MKKIILLFCFIAITQTAFVQIRNADSIIQLIVVEKDEHNENKKSNMHYLVWASSHSSFYS